ncbi:MAG: hypothetical protein AB1894_02245 [Chloroflexota bacterium]
MTVRTFDWRDLAALLRYRQSGVFLDSALVLTRGALLVPGALLSYLAPAMGVVTCVANESDSGSETLIGQYIHPSGSQFAHLTFLAPEQGLESLAVTRLLEYLSQSAGERGALRLLADVDEHSQAFEALRQTSFAIFARQRIWQLSPQPGAVIHNNPWRVANGQDALAIRLLYNNLVPGLVQQVEPFESQHPRGLMYYQDGELQAYVDLRYGRCGIWAQPFFHPEVEDVPARLADLYQIIPDRFARPLYFCVRSYQAWLEPAIEELGAEAGPRQAVMVRTLTVQHKALRPLTLPALEGGQPEISAPIARSESK